MQDREDGGPAFPVMPPTGPNSEASACGYPYPDSGMSLRDWFAGQALAGLMLHEQALSYSPEGIAHRASKIADAMIAQRKSGARNDAET